MWHPEQTWSVLHDERLARLSAPRVRDVEPDVVRAPPRPPTPRSVAVHAPSGSRTAPDATAPRLPVAARVVRRLAVQLAAHLAGRARRTT